jgi:hypothetical protein
MEPSVDAISACLQVHICNANVTAFPASDNDLVLIKIPTNLQSSLLRCAYYCSAFIAVGPRE